MLKGLWWTTVICWLEVIKRRVDFEALGRPDAEVGAVSSALKGHPAHMTDDIV